MTRPLWPVVTLSLLFSLAGCGGGGGAPGARVAIAWGARSRAVDGPSSALSAVITFRDALGPGIDRSFTVNRDSLPESHTNTYTSPMAIPAGAYELDVTFKALSNGQGDTVAVATGTISIDSQGEGFVSATTVGSVGSVEIQPGQRLVVGTPADLLVSVHPADAPDGFLGITPGSIFYAVTDGADKVRVANGPLLATAAGTATVVATVDGISSPPVTIQLVGSPAH